MSRILIGTLVLYYILIRELWRFVKRRQKARDADLLRSLAQAWERDRDAGTRPGLEARR